MNGNYNFNMFNEYTPDIICQSLKEIVRENLPVFVCVGSDLIVGDSLGPIIGSLLKQKGCRAYVYGTLNSPVTAKEIFYIKEYLTKIHKKAKIIAIDAALGQEEEIGNIKIYEKGIKPGLGVDKNLDEIGDISLIGIVSNKTKNNYNLYNATRLNFIYNMATVIANGIEKYLKGIKKEEYIIS